MFQQLCAIHCQCSSSRRQKSQLRCCWRNYKVAGKRLVLLSIYRVQSPFTYKVNEWWKDRCSGQQKNVQEIGAYQRSTSRGKAAQVWNWTQGTNQRRLFYPAVGEDENVVALLPLFQQNLRHWRIWWLGKRIVCLYTKWENPRVGIVTRQRLQWFVHCRRLQQFLPPNMLW